MDLKLLEYFINHTDKKFDEMREDLKSVRQEVQALNNFKWKVTGVAAAVVFMVEIARAVLFDR